MTLNEENNLKQIDTLDFRNNKRQLLLSYILRALGFLFFGYVFFIIAQIIKGNNDLTVKTLLEIQIQSLPAIVSIILLILDILVVLYMHELIHAAAFFITHNQKPKIGIRGLIIFAAAPNKVLSKSQMIVNGLAPFTVITVIGFVALNFLPYHFMSWVFIPTLINAAAAGGDFLIVAWAIKQPKNTKFIDIGDITNAYIDR